MAISNPFADGLSVQISAETSGLKSGIDDAISKMGDFRLAVLGAGAALGAISGAALLKSADAAADFQEAMVGVEKVTDPETAAAMEGKIQDLAETMPIAQEELAGIAEQAGRLGVEGVDNLASYTETVAQMATATDLTSEQASDAFARIGTLMDIPIEQSSNLGSAVNELSQTMGTSASEITDVMARAGGSLNQLGVGKEQALALAGAMNEVSPSSRLAAGGMKRMAEAMMDPKNVGAFAEALGVSEEEFKRMRDEEPGDTLLKVAEATAESKDAANVLKSELGKAGQEFQTLGENTESAREATETATEAWEENTSMQEEAATAASTFNSKLQITKNRFRNIGIEIGQRLLPYLSEFLDLVNDAIEWFSDLNDKTDGLLGTISLLGGLLGGVAVAAAALAPAIAAVAASFSILLGPVGLIILAIAGLAAAWQANLFGIQDVTRDVVERLRGAFQTFRTALGGLVDWVSLLLSGDFTQAWTQLKDAVVGIITTLGGRIKEVVTGFITDIVDYLTGLGTEDVKAAFHAIGRGIRTVVKAYLGLYKKVGKVLIGFVKDVVSWLKTDAKGDIKAGFEAAFDAIVAAGKAYFGLHKKVGEVIYGFITDLVDWLRTDAKDDIKSAIGAVIDVFVAAFEGLYTGLIGGSLIPEMFDDIADYIMNDAASDLADAATQAAEDMANALIDKFNQVIPLEVPIPEVTLGGGTIPNPIPGQDDFTLGTGTLGGGSWGMPQLASGGFIEEGGLAQLHAGERVVPAAQVTDRGEQTIKVEHNPKTAEEVRRLRDDLMAHVQSGGNDVTLKIGRREFGELITDIQNEQHSTWVTR